MAKEKLADQQESSPRLEGAESDAFHLDLPVDGGRTLSCTVRRLPEKTSSDGQNVQVLLSFKEPFFGESGANKELLLHWGVAKNPGEWLPPSSELMEQLRCKGQPVKFKDGASDIPFPSSHSSSSPPVLELTFPADVAPEYMVFVLHSPPNEWFKQATPGRPSTNFMVPLKQAIKLMLSRSALLKAIAAYKQTQPLQQIKPSSTRYWRTVVNDGDMQLLALTFVDKGCCGFELFCDWPAALLLHWGTVESENSTWKRMELNKMLVDVGSDAQQMQQSDRQEHRGTHKKEDSERNIDGQKKGKANDEPKSEDVSGDGCHLEKLYGTFAHYPIDNKAAQTLFEFCETSRSVGFQRVALCFRGDAVPYGISFVLKEVKADRWFADQAGDFFVKLPTHPYWETLREKYRKLEEIRAAEEAREREERKKKWNEAKQAFNKFAQEQDPESALTLRRVPLSDGIGELLVKTEADASKHSILISLTACLQTPCVLRWGMVDIMGRRQTELQKEAEAKGAPPIETGKGGRYQWICPPPEVRPPHTVVADPHRACETPFENSPDGLLQRLEIHVPALKTTPHFEGDPGIEPLFDGFACCLRERDADRWYKAIDNRDIQVRLLDVENVPCKGENRDYLEKIVEAEVEWQHMTLMHRYNLMRDFYESFARRSEARLSSSPEYSTRSKRVAELARRWSHRQWEGDEAPLPEGFGACMKKALAAHDLLACGELAATEAAEEKEFWELMFTWARFAFLGLLDWQRNYNTKPRELAHACESLTFYTARLWCNFPSHRPLIRCCLSTMGRGGSQGQAIRDRILEIMHKHHIPEHGSFYEQWHQKLHNNTTPDDIGICRAVIAFLESRGDLSAYWRVLGDHGISRERLASYERKITMEPHMLHTDINELINDFRAYLSVIQDVHDARDARKALDYARGYLAGDTVQAVERVVWEMGQRTDGMGAGELHHRFARLSEARRRICFQLNENGCLDNCDNSKIAATRELLMLDFVLEQQQGLLLQATASFDVQQLAMHLRELLLCLSAHDPFNVELTNLCADWQHLSGNLAASCASGDSSNDECREGALLLKALLDRLSRFVGKQVDSVQEGLGPKAQYLGAQVGTDKKVLDFFVDEVLRGSSLLSISFSIKRLEPLLRKAAKLPAWQLISVVEKVRGEFVTINELSGIQDKVFESPTILLCNAVSGEEEIPEGVQAVLVRSAAVSPDILSHVSVRARNANVLLAVCFDEAESGKLEELAGQWVEVKCTRDGSSLSVAAARKWKPDSAVQRTCSSLFDRKASQRVLETREEEELRKAVKQADKNVAILDASRDAPWAITSDKFTSSLVGSKSLNIAKLKSTLPKDVLTPYSIALPFGSLQRTLHAPENAETLKRLSEALRQLTTRLKNSEAEAIFQVCQKAIANVLIPGELRQALEKALQSSDAQGSPGNGSSANLGNRPHLMDLWKETGDAKCTQALVEVWASLFGLRPWISLTKASRDYCELNMAVLVQELLPVRYSFVLHTKNPFSQDKNELYGEIAAGLGEVIVGNYAGRAMGWTQTRNGEPRVIAFPSKSVALTCKQCLIFRSDSNGEDLEGFAGAGLFESIPAERAFWLPLCYWRQRLVSDKAYRNALLSKISKIGMLVEEVYGAPQDIEGVVIGEDTVALVQTRPQV
ncbi:alpha-glucan water dikinase 1, putative [Eimeria mitis]|uniref:Alpha-glucan water dikinase 1, putative n=1 Tax=Eimeria mitis TaxID=44415 RepID=U6K7V2_9EIME|nr:alpha-glucan water dikinase 1, putative [Eimeria mitis]CDJ32881.1 alpha-glucan water dikinase 1, putative [Eimeria mitis]